VKKLLAAGLAAALAVTIGGCQNKPQDAQAANQQFANSKVYIGALSCRVSGSTSFIIGSTRDLDCAYLTKDGISQGYKGTIRQFGVDIGYTKEGHILWHVFQVNGLVGGTVSTDPTVLVGGFIGQNTQVTASAGAGGAFLYGGANNQIVLQATEIRGSGGGYNLAYAIADIELRLKN